MVTNAPPTPEPGTALGAMLGADALFVACLLLGLFACGAVANIVALRRQARTAARLARRQSLGLRDLLRTVRMAETIAGIGVWQYDPLNQTQQWSEGLKSLFGIDTEEEFVEGDAETLLCANDIDLVGKVMARSHEAEPYELRFRLYGFDGVHRVISVQACNLMGGSGKVCRVVAVVRDVTEQVERERELESSRKAAMNEAHEARVLAETDALTGLDNRRRVMDRLDKMVMSARVSQMPMVLLMFDIDHFKRVNDTHGHPEGDKVLRRVAEIATEMAREEDVVGRVGGEEFVWIAPGASDNMARIMAERLRQTIASRSAAGGLPAVTISLGYTSIAAGDTALSLFARADNALYDAKHAGRNRVRMAA